MQRRQFIAASAAIASTPIASFSAESEAKPKPTRKVAIIGDTPRGKYGHGLDTVWKAFPEFAIVGVADPDADGLAKELKKLDLPASTGFGDYWEMLSATRPEFVSVCPRHPDQHRDMILAAIEFGAKGIYVEKPFVRTPAEADELITSADRAGAKIAVAHRNRWHPALSHIDQLIADDGIGRLLEIRGRGKGDRRGGGEDLWVLGSHVLNLMHYFGGAPLSCSATLLKEGKLVTAADVADGNEALGPLAGDELHARYRFEKSITGTFDSIANDGTGGHGFGLQLIGSKGIVNLRCDRDPLAHLVPGNPFEATGTPRPWIPITAAGVDQVESGAQKQVVAEVHKHIVPVRDLVDACDSGGDRQALCDAHAARITVEMICAVFDSHRHGGKAVDFPLEERGNALTKL